MLVLYGLPADLSSSILAHEAMHVWLKLQKEFPVGIDLACEEGLCQVVAHKYLQYLESLESEGCAGSSAPYAGSATSTSISISTAAPPKPVRSGAAAPTVIKPPAKRFRAFGNPVRTSGFDFRGGRANNATAVVAVQPTVVPAPQQQSRKGAAEDPNSRISAKLRRYFLHSIETDRSEVYGDGYRSAALAVQALSLEATLEHVRQAKALPIV